MHNQKTINMKYLRKYNESSSIDLKEVITIGLEDVPEFTLLECLVPPDALENTIELTEDFSNNKYISDLFDELNENYSNVSDVHVSYTMKTKAAELMSKIETYAIDVNTAIFDKLGKKFDFVTSNCNAFLESDTSIYVADSGNTLIYTKEIFIEFTLIVK